MKTDELWKVIEDHPNYMVSTHGNVLNIKRSRLLACPVGSNGYRQVLLYNDGKRTNALVHRLVASAFLENPNDLRTVNHKDEDKLNNNLLNLEWMSDQQNIEYSSAKLYKFINPKGELVIIHNMRKFCREFDLHQGAMCAVHRGEATHHKQWRALDGNSKGD